ncbi:hypothetical protein [Pedobacter borealis]|uniref:hypothetical protein n=1 Tax=Pedobacter borealis TaxID=475254 RepID=UPI0012F87E15|nr:hypothetical protein [Pedobacter borealis]
MKVNIILILCFFTITSFAQSKFADGFSRGYKKGYCYGQGVNCIEPISPIPPIQELVRA